MIVELIAAVGGALAVAGPIMKNAGNVVDGVYKVRRVAVDILNYFCKKAPENSEAALTQAVVEVAAMPVAAFEKKVDEIIEHELVNTPPEERRLIAEQTKLMKPRIHTTFARPEDPTGVTARPGWCIQGIDDLTPIIPPRPPLFKKGDRVPERPHLILTERLGIGGFGEVWKAINPEEEPSVIKFCLDPQSRDRLFKHERKIIKLVKTHLKKNRHIVKLLDSHLEGETPWLQYEYAAGGDLQHHFTTWPKDLAARATMAIEKILVLSDTMAKCHSLMPDCVIHRDLKPANIVIDDDGDFMITDFGIGDTQSRRAIDEAQLATVSSRGESTPTVIRWASSAMYASDEQRLGQDPHPSDDVHALGVMLYQFIIGDITRPASKTFIHSLEQRQVCRELISVITQAIADREDRYQNAGELAEALRKLPKQLIAPVKTQEEDDNELRAKFDAKVQEAVQKNTQANKLAEQRQWKPAKEVLDTIFHPVLRNALLYRAVCAYAEGKRLKNSIGMEFAYVPDGESWLGGGGGTQGTKRFVLEEPLLCGIYPVTQAEWQAVMGKNPSHFSGNPRFPVESISWDKITQEFLPALNKKCAADGYLYRLPTEDEWEYICRGGPISKDQSKFSYYFARSKTDPTPNPTNELSSKLAKFGEGDSGRPCDVGSYLPNPLGIFDMHGLVWEWTSSSESASRVYRGGGWSDSAEGCAAASRSAFSPDAYNFLGFRLLAVPLE